MDWEQTRTETRHGRCDTKKTHQRKRSECCHIISLEFQHRMPSNSHLDFKSEYGLERFERHDEGKGYNLVQAYPD